MTPGELLAERYGDIDSLVDERYTLTRRAHDALADPGSSSAPWPSTRAYDEIALRRALRDAPGLPPGPSGEGGVRR